MEKWLKTDLALAFCSLPLGSDVCGRQERARPCLRDYFSRGALQPGCLADAGVEQSGSPPIRTGEGLVAGFRGGFMFLGSAFQTAGLLYTTLAKSGFVTGSSVSLVPQTKN